jgi:hypothetical protein
MDIVDKLISASILPLANNRKTTNHTTTRPALNETSKGIKVPNEVIILEIAAIAS